MIVKPQFHGGGRIWLFEIDFTEDLKCVRRHRRSVGNQAVRHFEAILIGLMFQVAAVCV